MTVATSMATASRASDSVNSHNAPCNAESFHERSALLRSEPETPIDSRGPEQEAWNEPKINISRFVATNLSFVIMGMNDSCVGALIPYIGKYYHVSYTAISTLFMVPFLGYLTAALISNATHHAVGQRGIAFLGAICRLLAYVPLALHPPFPVIPVVMILTGLGNGLNDSAWNAWVGNMRNTNELLGLLHGAYGTGGIIAPLISSAMVTRFDLPWYAFYYVMGVLSVLELLVSVTSFWTADSVAYRARLQFAEDRKPITTREVLASPVPWIVSLFLFAYVGVEVSLGGWIPTFMINVRHAEGFVAGLTATLFWSGLTLGRVALGFVTGRVGEKLAITVYLCLCMTLQTVYWLVPNLIASMISVVFLGFFLGPLFPALIVTTTKLLPADQHVAAIGLSSALGGGGATVLPFVVGSMAEAYGVGVLQPFVLTLFVFLTMVWMSFPGGFRRGGLEQAREDGVTFFGGLKSVFGAGRD